jgi:hypothetical protein
MLFNSSRLRVAHPELFARQTIDRAEFGLVESRLTKLELETRNGLREVRSRVGALERRA